MNLASLRYAAGMKALALAVDDHSFNHMNDMRKNKDSMTETLYTYRLRGKDRVWGMNANFRSPQFHIISMLKIEGALQVLEIQEYHSVRLQIHTLNNCLV